MKASTKASTFLNTIFTSCSIPGVYFLDGKSVCVIMYVAYSNMNYNFTTVYWKAFYFLSSYTYFERETDRQTDRQRGEMVNRVGERESQAGSPLSVQSLTWKCISGIMS